MSAVIPYSPGELVAPLQRFACSVCTAEAGLTNGSYEAALDLLRHHGWRVGNTLICPKCVKQKITQFKQENFK
jgi:hypothetical protein